LFLHNFQDLSYRKVPDFTMQLTTFAGKISTMFTQGQLIFAGLFLAAFVTTAIIVYRKDKMLHRQYYKGSYKVLIGFLLFVAFLFFIKGYLKH